MLRNSLFAVESVGRYVGANLEIRVSVLCSRIDVNPPGQSVRFINQLSEQGKCRGVGEDFAFAPIH